MGALLGAGNDLLLDLGAHTDVLRQCKLTELHTY